VAISILRSKFVKLVIYIPCYNQEETLPIVLKSLPSHIKGIDEIQTIIVDDGSKDKTIEVAKSYGIKEFVIHRRNQGLSRSFRDGLMRSLELGADIIVMTEGDNQYKQERIADLIEPILAGKADLVIADRMTQSIEHFNRQKKILQKIGTGVLNFAADSDVPDAISGFRAYTRQAAMKLNPIAEYSWATETTLQASQKKLRIVNLPIPTNPKLRDSRQFKSSWQHVRRSSKTIMRAFIMYKPYALFFTLSIALLVLGLIPFGVALYSYIAGHTNTMFGSSQHLQGLVIGVALLLGSFISFTLGVIADLIRINRLLIEQTLEQVKIGRMGK
jgi:glycosyltransferase involved in cell wall biosynthesis